MNEPTKVEYRVKCVQRYLITRYQQDENSTGFSETKGEYDNSEVAHEVAYALCSAERDVRGWAIDDERLKFPKTSYIKSEPAYMEAIHE